MFATCKATTPSGQTHLKEFLRGVRHGKWKQEVEACRAYLKEGHQTFYESTREQLVPVVSLSRSCATRRKSATSEERLEVHSGLMQGDFDAKDHEGMDLDEIRKIIQEAPFTLACFASLSGKGAKAVFRVPADFKTHKGCFEAARLYFEERGLRIDSNTCDKGRLCYCSFDPDLFYNKYAVQLEPVSIPERTYDQDQANSGGTENIDHVRRVLAKVAAKIGPAQKRSTWLHLCGATQDAVGADAAGDIIDDFFPPQAEGHERACDVLPLKGNWNWNSMWKFGFDPVDHTKDFLDMGEDEDGELSKPTRKRLADFLVNHSDTLGMSWQQIDALRPPFVIDGFMRRGEVLLLGAESKSRKSWLTQDAGFAVAAGLPWLADENGAHGFPTAQARVHVFDLELNPGEMRYRFAKARGNRFAESPKEAAAMTAGIAAYSFDGQNVKEIMQRLEESKATVQSGDLVILDCLYRLCPDGNEVAPLAEILETVKRFASETQAGVILVDHFRKAGDEKARNRFAGSFVKQASASTLVAIEVTADDVLVLNIDARTFHGCPKVHARFNPGTYAFNRLPEIEVEKARQGRTLAEAVGWILRLWKGRPSDSAITAAEAGERWGMKRQGAGPRLGKLVSRGWLTETKSGTGKATKWTLSPEGLAAIKSDSDQP